MRLDESDGKEFCMEFPLIVQMALPQVLPLLPGFGVSLAVGVWLL